MHVIGGATSADRELGLEFEGTPGGGFSRVESPQLRVRCRQQKVWGERALRLSPFDPMSYASWLSISYGYLQRGEYQAAAEAAQKTFQANPYWSSAASVSDR
jgi:hypothetical protein